MIPVDYTDETGIPHSVDLSEPTRKEIEAMLKVVYPVAEVLVSISPTSIQYSAVPPGGGTPLPLTSSAGITALLLNQVKNRWEVSGSRIYDHHIAVFKRIIGSNYEMTGASPIPRQINEAMPISVLWDFNLSTLGCSLVPHEIGHTHGLKHAPTVISMGFNGCDFDNIHAPEPLDTKYPYANGQLSKVMGFNVESKTIVDTITSETKYHDIMGYRFPQHPSDYFFTKVSEWATSGSTHIDPQVMEDKFNQIKKNKMISLFGEFLGSGLTKPKLKSSGMVNREFQTISNEELLIQTTLRNGKKYKYFAHQVQIAHIDLNKYYWQAYIPLDDWVSYRLFHKGIDIGGESFESATDELKSALDRPLIILEGDLIQMKFPKKLTHSFSVFLVDDNNETIGHIEWNRESGVGYIPKDFLARKPAPRIRVWAGYGLKVHDFTVPLESNRQWTFRQLLDSSRDSK
jgi:hypothetical protein